MMKVLSNGGKVFLWLYVVVTSCAVLVKVAAVMPVRVAWLFEPIATHLSNAKLFFISLVLPLMLLTLWEIWDWDKLLTVRKHV